ncbi:MAG: redox-regulated ATPase YchF [Syntrophomonadaceae bacterium]|jgi:GTP-binding protein YchF|nr:redox-regulated ATPase YchF [Syntrophomonadaceae bacterium]
MQIGLVGLSYSGKTTLFQLLTGMKQSSSLQGKANHGMVKVPDSRVDYLSALYKPKKTIYATLEAVDIPGLIPGAERSTASFLTAVREADVLVHVIQDFENLEAPPHEGEINPRRDLELVLYELLLADLDQIERRIDRIKAGKPSKVNQEELVLLQKLKNTLEAEIPVSSLELSPSEELLVRNYRFLTAKPYVVVVNVDEAKISDHEANCNSEIAAFCREREIPWHYLSARIESEIAELDGEERQLFLEELNITESGLVTVTRLVYTRLGLISFFTVGEDEVKAWTITKGLTAREAAGKIHSDMERGFIRAEVIAFDDFAKAGSMTAARTEGTLRLEGKDYVVNDGDIIHFRFNV